MVKNALVSDFVHLLHLTQCTLMHPYTQSKLPGSLFSRCSKKKDFTELFVSLSTGCFEDLCMCLCGLYDSSRMSASGCMKHSWLNNLEDKAKMYKVRLKSQMRLQRYVVAHRQWKVWKLKFDYFQCITFCYRCVLHSNMTMIVLLW